VVRLNEKAEIFSAPNDKARVISRINKASTVNTTAKIGEFLRVELDSNRFAFVKAKDAKDVKGAKPAPVKDLTYVVQKDPPHINLSSDSTQGGVVTDGERFTLSGTVT